MSDEMYVQDRILHEVLVERLRQIDTEGWTLDHDDKHDDGEIARMGASYALSDSSLKQSEFVNNLAHKSWPFAYAYYKPTTRRRNLIKAMALLVAEIERLDRIEGVGDGVR